MRRISNGTLQGASSRPARFQLSISWHLGIAFCAVCILAIMANVIVEHGESIMRTLATSPRVNRAADISIAAVTEAEPLLVALNNFPSAVRARAQSDTRETTLSLTRARAELSKVLAGYSSQAQLATTNELKLTIHQLTDSGDKLISLADARRRTWAEYSMHFNAMNDRVKGSLEGAFKLFGRVLARQSLIVIGNQMDDLRRHFAALAANPLNEQAAMEALLISEQALAQSLQSNRTRLMRSEGAVWVDAMDRDFAQLVALAPLLNHVKSQTLQTDADLNKLEAEARRLVTATQLLLIKRNDDIAKEDKSLSSGNTAANTRTTVQAENKRTPINYSNDRNELIAWVSGAIVLFVLVICIRTVRGISAPIRDLLAGIDKIGTGQAPKSLEAGSITELNELVTAFNTMSGEVMAARQVMISNQHQLELKVRERTRELQELAAHDPLTSLPNRRQLFELLETDLRNAAQSRHLVGIFFLDIDNFKNINDSMDHTYGDRVLREVAGRLRGAIGTAGFAARLGGDEFTFVLSRATQREEITAFGHRVMQAFNHSIKIDQREIMVSVSIGASIYPEHGSVPEALLKAADSAVYRAKSLGRNQLLMFTPDLLEVASNRFTIEQGLRRALRNNEFELAFQPEVNAATLEVDLVEALIRWRMADGRLATPGEFLSIAEESGLIMDINDWVLHTAIAAAAQWHHGEWPAARVAINVSPRQLMDHGFVGKVESLLQEFHVPPACIEFELTENVLQTGPATLEALLRLRKQGIAIALDDFGSGYSTLASLEQLPLTRIKLDRSLIADIDTNERSLAIARAIIGLCHGLGIQITAEGIERPEQFALLAVYRSMHLQGFLFAKPMRRHEVLASLRTVSQSAQLQLLTMPHLKRHSKVVELASPAVRCNPESQSG